MDMSEFKIDPNIAYDVVELPSRGIYYENKKKSVRVAYLTAADENILLSQNLIETNTVITELLRRKVLDRDINIDEMVEDDRQAVLIFLRNTAFGSTYKIKALDSKTNKEFETEVDLSSLDFKEFNLVEDSNGEYTYQFGINKATITFKFLNRKQEDEIENIKKNWNVAGTPPPVITKQLEMMIKSVNGERDLMLIRNFIDKLPIKDSKEFRAFVSKNKPGIDLIKEIDTPSGGKTEIMIGFGAEFFRPFYEL